MKSSIKSKLKIIKNLLQNILLKIHKANNLSYLFSQRGNRILNN